MDSELLKQTAYDWESDPRKLKVDDMRPNGRCFHCGRIILNSSYVDAFCRDCHKAMSISRDGPSHDFDNFMNGKKALDRRETLIPIDFDEEEVIKNWDTSTSFKLGNGKPLTIEETEDHYKGLYELK